ncbi:hypothetical protein HNR67_006595 [Crossiella cryophila]|uniref:Uncharacterized protein n=1 Tax=Crossiella cryophila TaxID=43355 RepID=A0A7W7CGF6_9PSEU|nr:hypothetical protein [Crossiella cryophila]
MPHRRACMRVPRHAPTNSSLSPTTGLLSRCSPSRLTATALPTSIPRTPNLALATPGVRSRRWSSPSTRPAGPGRDQFTEGLRPRRGRHPRHPPRLRHSRRPWREHHEHGCGHSGLVRESMHPALRHMETVSRTSVNEPLTVDSGHPSRRAGGTTRTRSTGNATRPARDATRFPCGTTRFRCASAPGTRRAGAFTSGSPGSSARRACFRSPDRFRSQARFRSPTRCGSRAHFRSRFLGVPILQLHRRPCSSMPGCLAVRLGGAGWDLGVSCAALRFVLR